MSAGHFDAIPEPPCYAVIFTSQRNQGDECAYRQTAERMEQLAATIDGFLGVESARDETGFGITVSYWRDREAIARWKEHAEHAAAREKGKSRWYEHYIVCIARVEKAYDGKTGQTKK